MSPGRIRAEQSDPELVATLGELIGLGPGGYPSWPLQWTVLSTRTLALALTDRGHPASSFVVRRMLRSRGFILAGNARATDPGVRRDRESQFHHINLQACRQLALGHHVLFVEAERTAVPGIHAASMAVDDVAAPVAAGLIRAWWSKQGQRLRPRATGMLVAVPGAQSDRSRIRPWRAELAPAARHVGVIMTVCHIPPGSVRLPPADMRMTSTVQIARAEEPELRLQVSVRTLRRPPRQGRGRCAEIGRPRSDWNYVLTP